MLWSELEGKELINIRDGHRLGRVADADIVFDPESGAIRELHVPARSGVLGLARLHGTLAIPWSCVRSVGPDVLLVDVDQLNSFSRA